MLSPGSVRIEFSGRTASWCHREVPSDSGVRVKEKHRKGNEFFLLQQHGQKLNLFG